jgi:hypothetical protein
VQNEVDNIQNDDSICTKVLFNKPPSTDNVDFESIATEMLFNFAKIPERIEQIEEDCEDSTTDKEGDINVVNVNTYKSEKNFSDNCPITLGGKQMYW